jgi:hypothetical protein
MMIYINGVLDASGGSVGPYLGTKGDVRIGTNDMNYDNHNWDGCLDELSYSSRALK